MKKKFFIIFFTILAITSTICFSEEITLNEYIELVRLNHPFFENANLDVEISRMNGVSLLSGQEWIFSLTPYYNYYGEVGAYPSENVNNTGGVFGVNKPLWNTGGNLGFYLSSDFSHYNSTPLSSGGTQDSNLYTQGFSISFMQPLIRNIGGSLYWLEYDLNEYMIKLNEVEGLELQEDFLLNLALRFIDWIHLSEQISLSNERLSLAEEQLEQTNRMYNSNLVDKVDVIRAEDAVLNAKLVILQLESMWKALQVELSVFAQSDQLNTLNPLYELYSLIDLPDADESLEKLNSQARILMPFFILQEQLAHKRKGYEDQMLPELNLNISAGVYGSDEEFVESLKMIHPNIEVSLELIIPSGYNAEEAQIEKIDLQIEQLKVGMNDIKINLEANLRNLLIQIFEIEKILEINRELIISAEERTTEEARLYSQGRGQLTFVIQSRDSEQNAKLNYARNAALYHKLVIQYNALMDELLF